jgi:hypothetical protein
MSTPHLFDFVIGRVRLYIRDSKELNKLLGNKFESDDPAVRQAIIDAINDWNISQPPLTPIDLRTHPAKLLLIRKACLELLRSAGIWHSREHMPSQDGGTSADDHAKFAEYSQWIGMIEADYERKKTELKVSQNVAQCFGGVASEYSYGWEDWGYNFRSVDMVSGYPQATSTGCTGDTPQNGDAFFDPLQEPETPTSPPVSEPVMPEKTGDVLTFIVNSTHAPSKKLFTIPANATVYEIRVQVQVAFSGGSGVPEITVGDVGQTDRLVQAFESDLSTVGTYVVNVDYTYATATDIYVYIGNVPVIGTCKVIMSYDMAQS